VPPLWSQESLILFWFFFFFIGFCSPVLDHCLLLFFGSLIYFDMVDSLDESQGLYLHRATQHRKTRTNIHAFSVIRTRYPVYERSRPAPQTARSPDRYTVPVTDVKFPEIFNREKNRKNTGVKKKVNNIWFSAIKKSILFQELKIVTLSLWQY
jgi:hypothetical protein